MSKLKKWIIVSVILLLAAGICVGAFGFLLPWHRARSAMPEGGVLIIEEQEDGALQLSWPEADQADRYHIRVMEPAASEEEEPVMVYQEVTTRTSTQLPRLSDTEKLTIYVTSAVDYKTLTGEEKRFGSPALEVTTVFDPPEVTDLEWTVDVDTKTVSLHYKAREGDLCSLTLIDGDGNETDNRLLESKDMAFTFGEEADLPLPGFGKAYTFKFDACREEAGLKFYGRVTQTMSVSREDLMGRDLGLVHTELGDNVWNLTWNETKGEHYEVQMLSGEDQWETVSQIAGDGERSYNTIHLEPFETFTYRVVAVGGQVMEDSEFAAVSEEISLETIQSVIFATVWPNKDMPAYADPQKSTEAGSVTAGEALCVLEEKDGMFGVGIDGKVCYIDSSCCLINLPEYMGDLCAYKITNSYSSLYMMHEFELPGMSGEVTAGYEYVKQSDGSYLVPLLYPTAKKLVTAAQNAIAEGYRLKIYDSFRPNVATREMYTLAEKMLNEPLPEKPFTNADISDLDLPEVGEEEVLTYGEVMLGGFALNYYVAKGRSNHNLGIALDLTIESLDGGKELKMQTSMHDLSQYSGLKHNNRSANTLAKIMKSAGFSSLVSEWWHFNDLESRDGLKPATVYNGVNARGWVADDFGWRYRTKRGNYYCDTTETIGGVEYTFDAEGYVKN